MPSLSLFTISDNLRDAKKELAARYLSAERPMASGARMFSAAVSPVPTQNVVGVGIGEKVADSGPTGTLAVKLFVRAKVPSSQLASTNLLPREIEGVPTDVEEVGLILPQAKKKPAAKKAKRRGG